MAKPKRRQFTALLPPIAAHSPARLAACFAASLYSSHLATWRKARRKGSLRELASKSAARNRPRNPLDAKVRVLEAKVARLEHELHFRAHDRTCREKLPGCWD